MMASENGHSAALGAWPLSPGRAANRPVPSPGPLEPGCPLLVPSSVPISGLRAAPPHQRLSLLLSEFLLYQAKANITVLDVNKNTALHLACSKVGSSRSPSPSPCHLNEGACSACRDPHRSPGSVLGSLGCKSVSVLSGDPLSELHVCGGSRFVVSVSTKGRRWCGGDGNLARAGNPCRMSGLGNVSVSRAIPFHSGSTASLLARRKQPCVLGRAMKSVPC